MWNIWCPFQMMYCHLTSFGLLMQLIYEKLPQDISDRHVLLLDPILGTGLCMYPLQSTFNKPFFLFFVIYWWRCALMTWSMYISPPFFSFSYWWRKGVCWWPFFKKKIIYALVISSGNSAVQAISLLLKKGVPESNIIFLNLISVSYYS